VEPDGELRGRRAAGSLDRRVLVRAEEAVKQVEVVLPAEAWREKAQFSPAAQ
jgi:hypothetical protein